MCTVSSGKVADAAAPEPKPEGARTSMSLLKALQKTIFQTTDEKELFEEARDGVWKRFKFKNNRSAFLFFLVVTYSFYFCRNPNIPFCGKKWR